MSLSLNLILQHIGKIEAVGTVQVFGYAAQHSDRYSENLVYLNYAGPPTATDSVWARLIDDRLAVDFTDLRGRPHRIGRAGYPGLVGKEAPFKRFVTRIEHLAIDHCILLDKRFFQPDYDADISLTFVFDGHNAADKIGQHIAQCVDIAVFPEWHAGLLALGRRARLITPLHSYGGHPVYQITLDRTRWTQVIALAVEQQELTWPGQETSRAAERLLSTPVPEPEHNQALLSVTLPDYLIKQGWHVQATAGGMLRACGPDRNTSFHRMPGSSATVNEVVDMSNTLVREIEQLSSKPAAQAGQPARPATLAHQGWCSPIAGRQPTAQTLAPYLQALSAAAAYDNPAPDDDERLRQADASIMLADILRRHIASLDFWDTPQLVERMRAEVKVFLDDRALAPYEQLDDLVERLVTLARAGQAELLEQMSPTAILPGEKVALMKSLAESIGRPSTESPLPQADAVSFSLTHEGDWTWLSFEKKPSEWVLTRLNSTGFHWGKKRRAWYTRQIVEQDQVQRLLA